MQADILIINKIDLAPYVGASLAVMEDDTKIVRGNRPYILTNCKTGEGIDALVDMIEKISCLRTQNRSHHADQNKASPAFDTLSLGRVGARTGKVSTRAPQMASGAVGKHGYLRLRFADRGAKAPSMKWKERCHCWFKKPLLG
ncbi:urease accessory protein UreG [Klebsiella pneumoniae]|uniref:Urease accessory protein UreG n=1 Tax=Klebsiella pneumoniae TaxID=573 RepID=A0A377U2J4_KLEPN|nr:urease accessory protein UreG [Klebsiella pneumoniae]